jgi:hypothetical protein
MNRALDAKILHILERRLSQHVLEPARQRALAGAAERKAVDQVAPRPLLETLDDRVGVREWRTAPATIANRR